MIITKNKLKPAYPELRGNLSAIRFPALADFKLDGEFQYIIVDKDSFCINKYGTVKTKFPALDYFKVAKQSAVLVGELHLGNGEAGSFYKMQKVENKDILNLYPFDILKLDGVDLRNKPLIDRLELLLTYLQSIKYPIPCLKMVHNKTEAEEYFKLATETYKKEGIVLKNLNETWRTGPCTWCKMKWKDQSDYEVIMVDQTMERIEVKVPAPTGGAIRVGVKAPMRYKRHIKLGDTVTIEHQGVLESGSLRHPVLIPKKEWK